MTLMKTRPLLAVSTMTAKKRKRKSVGELK